MPTHSNSGANGRYYFPVSHRETKVLCYSRRLSRALNLTRRESLVILPAYPSQDGSVFVE